MPIREWPALEGRVLDAQTEEPVEGAFVVAHWIGYGGYSQSQCFHVEAVQTDAQGLFRIPEWRNEQRSSTLSDQRRSVDVVYKPGYRFAERTYREQSQMQGVWYLEVDPRTVGGRLQHLELTMSASSCDAGESEKSIYYIRKEIYYEAKSLGAPLDTLRWMRRVAASSAIAGSPDMTGPERDKRIHEFLKDHLE